MTEAAYLPSLTFASPRTSTGSKRPSLFTKSPRRSMAEDYWTSPTGNFGFSGASTPAGSTPAASRPVSIKAAKKSASSEKNGSAKKSLMSRVKKAVNKSTEEYWGGAVQNAKFGIV